MSHPKFVLKYRLVSVGGEKFVIKSVIKNYSGFMKYVRDKKP